jgi:hypothetical protein
MCPIEPLRGVDLPKVRGKAIHEGVGEGDQTHVQCMPRDEAHPLADKLVRTETKQGDGM